MVHFITDRRNTDIVISHNIVGGTLVLEYTTSSTPKVPGRYLKCPKHPEGPLIDNRPTKRVKIEKGRLFDLLPTNTFKIIYDWDISSK